MGGAARFIAGDWGTTHLRLFLCDADGTALDHRSGPGAVESAGRFDTVLASQTAAWELQHGPLPTVLCGMVGSSLGWVQVPYVPCPARPEHIAAACTSIVDGRVHIVPGLSCQNRFGAPDLLRGEETQLLGAFSRFEPRQLVCLPGTHTKWVVVEEGQVRDFFTAPTGELFAVLRDHSVLVRPPQGGDAAPDAAAFNKAVASVAAQPDVAVLHRLFECRSRPLSGDLPPTAAAAYLSGLLIASDVHGALRALSNTFVPSTVVLIGAPQLTQRYASACATLGLQATQIDGATASLAGLTQIHRRLS
jgi:2-dehydro-3-deoxygalactonokinase